jgi:putative membrane protein
MTFACSTLFVLVPALVLHLALVGTVDDPTGFRMALWIPVVSVLGLLWLVGGVLTYVWYRNLSFEIAQDRVIINKGILSRIEQNIPFRKVTDFRLHRSLFDRWLGIGSIDVQTPGQSQSATGYEGRLAGLREWSALHDELLARLGEMRVLGEEANRDVGLAEVLEELQAIHEVLESR